MKICDFKTVEDDIISHLREKRLIPIIGSGFSAGSLSFGGTVPTGREMKADMIQCICQYLGDNTSVSSLNKKSFNQIATYYHKIAPKNVQRIYIRDRFTNTNLNLMRKQFLDINWLYIYTLNVDDAIERNSVYNHVLVSNRIIDFSILSDKKCVIKLHGDANNILSYQDDNSQIFDFKQYAKSIESNTSLLKKLRHDFTYNNLLYIGCSLDDEFDLVTLEEYQNTEVIQHSSKYFLAVEKPDQFKQLELEQYGITHIVLFDDFESIYELIINAYKKSIEIPSSEIDCYRSLSLKQLAISYNDNQPYLFHGKSLLNQKSREVCIPNFFIDRDLTEILLKELDMKTIHIVYGNHVSGKSYLLISLFRKIKNRDVFFFDSKASINEQTLRLLLNSKGSLLIFDTSALNKGQIFNILRDADILKENEIAVVIAVNKSDKDIISVINENRNNHLVKGHYVKPYFSVDEVKEINPLLSINQLPDFSTKKSIIDSLVDMERVFQLKGVLSRIEPNLRNTEDIVVLILLAVKEKLYTQDLTKFDVDMAGYLQVLKSKPLISEEHVLYFEQDNDNSSQRKIVVSAKYWLYETLGSFAKRKQNYPMIVDAFKHIVNVILYENNKSYYNSIMDFIKFDIINEIFPSKYKGQLSLGHEIYEGLHNLLSSDERCAPHYYHQRAKCYLWQSGYEESFLGQLDDALRFAKLARQKLDNANEKAANQKLEISIAHIQFTICLILARKNIILNNSNDNVKSDAICAIYDALLSPYNYNEFIESGKGRRRSGDDIVDIRNTITPSALNGLDKDVLKKAEYILNFLITN